MAKTSKSTGATKKRVKSYRPKGAFVSIVRNVIKQHHKGVVVNAYALEALGAYVYTLLFTPSVCSFEGRLIVLFFMASFLETFADRYASQSGTMLKVDKNRVYLKPRHAKAAAGLMLEDLPVVAERVLAIE